MTDCIVLQVVWSAWESLITFASTIPEKLRGSRNPTLEIDSLSFRISIILVSKDEENLSKSICQSFDTSRPWLMRAYLLGVLWCGSSPFDEYSREDSSTYANSFAVLCQNLPQNLYLHVSFTWRTGESTRFDPRSWRLSLVLVLASVVYRQFLGFTVPHLFQSFKFQFHFVKFKKIEKKNVFCSLYFNPYETSLELNSKAFFEII